MERTSVGNRNLVVVWVRAEEVCHGAADAHASRGALPPRRRPDHKLLVLLLLRSRPACTVVRAVGTSSGPPVTGLVHQGCREGPLL